MGIAVRIGFAGAALCVLAACGGGGGGGNSQNVNPGNNSGNYTPGVFPAQASLAQQCTAFNEKMWLRSWTNDFYLWFAEVPDTNPNSITDVIQYFNSLKTSQTTPSGRAKDRFHFTFDTDEWRALSQQGQSFGYGAELMIIGDGRPPRRAVVAFVEPGTPAATANVTRGMEIQRINNVDFVNDNTQAGVDTLNAAFSPSAAGQTFTFVFRPTTGADVTIPLTSASITHKPVLLDQTIPQSGASVGYLVFNDHIATAEDGLFDAITRLQGVNDLILDIRYNGGGFLDIASELSYMISGRTGTFESLVFNSKNPGRNPVLNQPLTPTPIHTTTQDFGDRTPGTPLPTLNLNRVYVITGPNTCSASESIINGLRGVGVEVFLIGSTTCGKPFGFFPQDNCGTTYFSIQFQGLNAMSFGDYPDGFAAQNQSGASSVKLGGCSLADDFTHALGDTQESRLKATLAFRASGNSNASCPTASGFAPGVPGAQLKGGQQAVSAADGYMIKSPLRENRIIRDR